MEILEISDTQRFRLVRKLATGGMGAVYEALQDGAEGFEKVVALKTILEEYSTDPTFVQMFIGEAKLVADLIHQNIVQIYQLGKHDKTYYIAMEFIEGVNLEDFLRKHKEMGRRMPVDIAAFIASRVCRGLEYAHAKCDKQGRILNVVHRDISPKNIMISIEGVAKITDFGIAKAANVMMSQEGDVLMGKLQYMSPEQAQFKETDRRSDIFSLGIVFYEMLAGTELFDGEKSTHILRAVIQQPIPSIRQIREDVPVELESILLKALERDLDLRYQDAGQMGYDLEYFMYHDRFGPNNPTLAKYLFELYPDLAPKAPMPVQPDPERCASKAKTIVIKKK
ncbi:MAG: serine/threonine-protein kinase [Planctomycetota bacterium]